MAKVKPGFARKKRNKFDFDAILLLLMLSVGCISALGGFLFGRNAMQEVTPFPTDRRVLKPSQIQKPRKVNLFPSKQWVARGTVWTASWIP